MSRHGIVPLVIGAAAALAVGATPAPCQMLSNEIILTPRAIAMGSAITAGRNEIEFLVGNPAGLMQVGSNGGGAALAVSNDLDSVVAGAISRGGVSRPAGAFGFMHLEDDVNGFEDTVIGGGVATRPSDNLAVGLSIMHHSAKLTGMTAEKDKWTFDVGMQYTFRPNKPNSPVLGASASNITGETIPGTDAQTVFNVGAKLSLDPDGKVNVLADWVDVGDQTEQGARFRAGVEARIEQGVLVRAGVNDGTGTLGIGYAARSWRVDAGWQNDTSERRSLWVVGASTNF
ncbi:MAG: outer membrane beta-barrel protein [Armatimonadota bacterium]